MIFIKNIINLARLYPLLLFKFFLGIFWCQFDEYNPYIFLFFVLVFQRALTDLISPLGALVMDA